MSSFEGENMQTQYNVLSYRIDLYFHDYKLAIEIDENEHSERNIDYEIKRQKEGFNIFRTINEIFKYIKQSTKGCNKENFNENIRIRV